MNITKGDIGKLVRFKCGTIGEIVGFTETPKEIYPVLVRFHMIGAEEEDSFTTDGRLYTTEPGHPCNIVQISTDTADNIFGERV